MNPLGWMVVGFMIAVVIGAITTVLDEREKRRRRGKKQAPGGL